MNALRTDLYEIRMAASYLRRGMTAPATFSLFVRDLPRRGFLIAAGLAECLDLLRDFRFEPEELAYVGQELGFPATDVEALSRLRFTGDVRAVPEGRAVFAGEPLLEVTAPLPEAQLVETMLLNSVTFATAVATKAARCRLAAPRAELVDFSARRAHGGDAALAAARLTALAGFSRTSNVEGAARYGLRAAGTVAHSYIQAFRSEPDAFRAFVEDFPAAPVLLVDTYDPGEPDVLATTGEPPCSGRDVLLLPVMLGGRSLGQPSVSGSRRRCEHDLASLPPPARRLRRPEPVGVVHSTALASLAADVAGRVGEDNEHAATVAR